jgi:hypothetical protein
MSEQGIDKDGIFDEPQIIDSSTALFRYQYARVDDNFRNTFNITDANVVDADVEDGDEVFRRIRQTTAEARWPARTSTASATLIGALRDAPYAGAATRQRSPAGWYDVTATLFIQSGSWSAWKKVENLDIQT